MRAEHGGDGILSLMLSEYLAAAMRHAHYQILEDTGEYYGEIPGFQGVWASASTLEECREELGEVLEDWLLFRVAEHLELPEVDGLRITIQAPA